MAEQNDKLLPGGLRFFNPTEKAPDFVLCSMVITMNDLFKYCKENQNLLTEYNGQKQLKVQVLVAKSGKVYGRVDDYKPEEKPEGRVPVNPNKQQQAAIEAAPAGQAQEAADDLPF